MNKIFKNCSFYTDDHSLEECHECGGELWYPL